MNEVEELHPHDGATGHFSAKVPSSVGRIADFHTGEDGVAAGLVIASIHEESYDLVDPAFDESLTTSQVDEFLAGGFDAVRLQIMASLEYERSENALSHAYTHAELVDVSFDELPQIDQGQVLAAVFENEETDLLYRAVQNTGPQLMRVALAADIRAEGLRADPNGSLTDYDRDNRSAQQAARTAVIRRVLEGCGVDETNRVARLAVHNLVNDGPADWHEEVSLYVIWYGNVEAATAVDWTAEPGTGRRLSFPAAHIMLRDARSGQTSVQLLRHPINLTVTEEAPAQTDSPANGASGHGLNADGTPDRRYATGDPAGEWLSLPDAPAPETLV